MPRTARKSMIEKKTIKAQAKSIRKPVRQTKMKTKASTSSPTTMLSLPQEMLQEIITKMPSQDRAPLGFVCRQIRAADLEVPREFECIEMRWEKHEQSIWTWNMDYKVSGSNEKPIQATPHNLSFFRRAKTEALNIVYEKDVKDPKANFEVITSLCESIDFDKLRARWYNTADCAEEFFPGFFANRDSSNAQLYLLFDFLKSSKSNQLPNIPTTRKLLMKLPKLKNFQLRWMGWNKLASNILDDATILHIVSNTDHAVLDRGQFTAQGLLDVFEVVCKSDLPQKFVQISSNPGTNGVQDLMRKFQIHYRGMHTEYRHVDRERQAVLHISGGAFDTVCFQMHKIDQNEFAMFISSYPVSFSFQPSV